MYTPVAASWRSPGASTSRHSLRRPVQGASRHSWTSTAGWRELGCDQWPTAGATGDWGLLPAATGWRLVSAATSAGRDWYLPASLSRRQFTAPRGGHV